MHTRVRIVSRMRCWIVLSILIAAVLGLTAQAGWDTWTPPSEDPVFGVDVTAAAAIAPFDPFPNTGTAMSLFTNKSGVTVTGLVLYYTGMLDIPYCVGVGAEMGVVSNADGVLRLEGYCVPFGTLSIDWILEEASLTRAVWVIDDEEILEINLNLPIARFTLAAEGGLEVSVCVNALGSKDPSGAPLSLYSWEWSDGVITEGIESHRTFSESGRYTVVLTVTTDSGLTSSARGAFTIAQEEQEPLPVW